MRKWSLFNKEVAHRIFVGFGGHTWLLLVAPGHSWSLLVAPGRLWSCFSLVAPGCSWSLLYWSLLIAPVLVTPGHSLSFLVIPWSSLVVPGHSCSFPEAALKAVKDPLGYLESMHWYNSPKNVTLRGSAEADAEIETFCAKKFQLGNLLYIYHAPNFLNALETQKVLYKLSTYCLPIMCHIL